MTIPAIPQPCSGAIDGERLLRPLSNIDRLPLLMCLVTRRSELELRREFPGVRLAEHRRSLALFASAGWIQQLDCVGAGVGGWRVTSEAIHAFRAWLLESIPDALPSPDWSADALRIEVIALRRRNCRAVLRALRAGVDAHADLVSVTGLQSGTVSDVLGRLEMAGIVAERRLSVCPPLHLLCFAGQLQRPVVRT